MALNKLNARRRGPDLMLDPRATPMRSDSPRPPPPGSGLYAQVAAPEASIPSPTSPTERILTPESENGDIQSHPDSSVLVQHQPQPKVLHEISDDDVIIAVIGPTGVGKSNFINIATNDQVALVGHTLASSTKEVQAIVCKHRDGVRNVVFIDTPGTDDDQFTDLEILERIAQWLEASYKKKVHLSGLLWLHRISDRRMGETALKNIAMFEQLCGKSALGNVVLVTTMWGDVEEEAGRTRETQLKRLYWKAMISAGSQMMRFDDTPESAWAIIAQLKPQRIVTQLQNELVNQRRPFIITSASQAILGWFDRVFTNLREKTRKFQRGRGEVKEPEPEVISQLPSPAPSPPPIPAPVAPWRIRAFNSSSGSIRRRGLAASRDANSSRTVLAEDESRREAQIIRECLRAGGDHLRLARAGDGVTALQDIDGDDHFFQTLGFALNTAERLLALAMESSQSIQSEFLGVVLQAGKYLVAVAELTRSYGLRGWNGELAKIIHLLAKVQRAFAAACTSGTTWQPSQVTRRNPLSRQLADWQKVVQQSCEMFDVKSPIPIEQAIAQASTRLDQAPTPT